MSGRTRIIPAMGPREHALWDAQTRAAALFAEVLAAGLIRPGISEAALNEEIHTLARDRFEVKRHWHRRIVRSGENTLATYFDETGDRQLLEDDMVFLDFGPVFGEWEADFGRSYVLGSDPRKHRLVQDINEVFALGKSLFEHEAELTAGQLYDFVVATGEARGWSFGGPIAGHLVDHFPHSADPSHRFDICSGNRTALREPFEDGRPRHWILEIHFVDRAKRYGGFLEELLTIHGPEG